MFISIV